MLQVKILVQMAIVLDDVVVSANDSVEDYWRFSVNYSRWKRSFQEVYDEANQLSLVLKSVHPATITVLERQVGATLGRARQGVKGILVGLAAVLFFMVVTTDVLSLPALFSL